MNSKPGLFEDAEIAKVKRMKSKKKEEEERLEEEGGEGIKNIQTGVIQVINM